MLGLGPTELIILLIIIILLFGVGRISKIASEMGRGVREFRDGLAGKADESADAETDSEKK
ncbi:MAG: hypothetical protein JETCAE02_02880 [Anaerolineaceae bacterium]|jgi:sec-independent protein translocase protein TatA|nr:twin-arginine translocase TatA/TatE family subunit [Anaerolineae bacterium]MBL1172701.1 twin-arginine translocase TatA/TatE family subunit [Chloroflexota bacterium]MBV6465547.1 Sec-independent protein translocase protein TatA [Anaerolineales bacterium]MCE7919553.1 twin-arginine translocase TatA/TatE family subunit [Chloroflexi bacterium CFX1]OQY84867.1 MAG: hypothetical protein B6D40_04730 [Anaerolineae bacterium UTCFX3]GER80130.1 conserved hypothetical protein [Candidatus Denitrolinea symb